MNALEQQVASLLHALHGDRAENAYHTLIELGPDVIPMLALRFRSESDRLVRSTLVNISWQTRSARALPLLEEALDDRDENVWKEALDGLVALGGQAALEAVRQALPRAEKDRVPWLEEAEQQLAADQ